MKSIYITEIAQIFDKAKIDYNICYVEGLEVLQIDWTLKSKIKMKIEFGNDDCSLVRIRIKNIIKEIPMLCNCQTIAEKCLTACAEMNRRESLMRYTYQKDDIIGEYAYALQYIDADRIGEHAFYIFMKAIEKLDDSIFILESVLDEDRIILDFEMSPEEVWKLNYQLCDNLWKDITARNKNNKRLSGDETRIYYRGNTQNT